MRQKALYIFVLFLSLLLAIIALGGGLFNQAEPWFLQWQHKIFAGLCHQQTARSFWVNGQPMAVCSRCLGIYCGFFMGLVTAPFSVKWIKSRDIKKLLLLSVILNIVDVAGSISGFWSNTLLSRFAIGFLLAVFAGLLLGQAFTTQNQITINKKSYGANRPVQ